MKLLFTFYSHYEALKAKKVLEKNSLPARLISVPRSVSSSCGTAIRSEAEYSALPPFEREGAFEELEDGSYRRITDG